MPKPSHENIVLVQGETLNRAIRLCSYLRVINHVTVTAASTSLTSKTAKFDSADVGRKILVFGAGANGGLHSTTIVGIVSSIEVTLLDAAVLSLSGTKANIFTPVNLTGWTFKSEVRTSEESTSVLQAISLAITVLDGRIVRSIPELESQALVAGRYWHDLRSKDTLNQVRVWTRGRFTVLDRITE